MRILLFVILFLNVSFVYGQEVNPCKADIDENGDIDMTDFLLFVQHFGKKGVSPCVSDTITLTVTNTDTVAVSTRDTIIVTNTDTITVSVTNTDTIFVSTRDSVVVAPPRLPVVETPVPGPFSNAVIEGKHFYWLAKQESLDLNNDGQIDGNDFLLFLRHIASN